MKNDKRHNMGEYYNERAPEYEQIYYRDNKPRREEIDTEAERLKKLASGKTILEFACGTGYWTERLSQTATTITAFDLSEKMITQAKQKTYHCPVRFIQSDMYTLPVAGQTFDLVAVGFWFSHEPIQQYDRFFELISSYAVENGSIWMIDNNPPAEGDVHQSTGIDDFGNNYKKRFLDNGEEYVILKNYFTEEQLQQLFSTRFKINRLTYQRYYWAVELALK